MDKQIEINGITYKAIDYKGWESYPCADCPFSIGNGECSLPFDDCELLDNGSVYNHQIWEKV